MVQHELEIHALYEFEGGPVGWYSKGHHPESEFRQAILKTVLRDTISDAPFSLVACAFRDIGPCEDRPVEHKWWRVVPVRDYENGGVYGSGMFYDAKPHTHGAFPVTVVYGV